jgi:hypothetical protein
MSAHTRRKPVDRSSDGRRPRCPCLRACDEDRNRILNGSVSCGGDGVPAGRWAACGLVAAVEVDRGVAERGKPGDVGGVGVVVPVGCEVVEGEGGLDVDGLPQHIRG